MIDQYLKHKPECALNDKREIEILKQLEDTPYKFQREKRMVCTCGLELITNLLKNKGE